MSNDLNLCQFIGRLGADPETRTMPSGDSVTNIRLAVGWKSKEKEGVEWVPIVFFGRLGEVVAQYLTKGSRIYVSGRFRTQSWEKDGEKRYRTEVVGNEMQMLDTKRDGERRQSEPKPAAEDSGGGGFSDDIPFASAYQNFQH